MCFKNTLFNVDYVMGVVGKPCSRPLETISVILLATVPGLAYLTATVCNNLFNEGLCPNNPLFQ